MFSEIDAEHADVWISQKGQHECVPGRSIKPSDPNCTGAQLPATSADDQSNENRCRFTISSDEDVPEEADENAALSSCCNQTHSVSTDEGNAEDCSVDGVRVWKKSKKITAKEAINICLHGKVQLDKVCTRVPPVEKRGVYIIDLTTVDASDLTTDDSGAYSSHSTITTSCRVSGEIVEIVHRKKLDLSTIEQLEKTENRCKIVYIKRQYSYRGQSSYARQVIKCVSPLTGEAGPYAIIEYTGFMSTGAHHGNAKKQLEPYIRTKPSIIDRAKKMSVSMSPKHVIQEIDKQSEGGGIGIGNVTSLSNILRNRQQVYNASRGMQGKQKNRDTGPQKEVDYGKLVCLMTKPNSFLKDVSFTQKKDSVYPNTFAIHPQAVNWINKFCSPVGCGPKSQTHIDMTYKVGHYYVTLMTFSHPMFVFKGYVTKHPTILLAMTTTNTRDEADYKYFASKLHSGGVKRFIYGTDGEFALEKGFESVFPITGVTPDLQSIHLRCFTHLDDDLKAELKKLNMDKKKAKEIRQSILGSEYKGIRIKGLVDCSDSEFETEWEKHTKDWPQDFVQYLNSTKLRVRSMKETLKRCMLRSVRIAAGMGDPPNKFANQRAESFNNVLKEETGHVKVDQVALHEMVENNIIQQQNTEMTKAVFGMGEYRLAPEFQHLQRNPVQWKTMSVSQRQECIDKVLGKGTTQTEMELEEKQKAEKEPTKKLSVQPEQCSFDLPIGMLQQMWHRAEAIISFYDVQSLPSGDFLVTEYASATVVQVDTGDSALTCQCKDFNLGICAHVLAVSEKINQLQDTLDIFTKKFSTSKVIAKNLPWNAGLIKKNKKPRKGKNNITSQPIHCEREPPARHADICQPRNVRFTEVHHNNEPFNIAFTPMPTPKKPMYLCETCKVQIRGGEICVSHRERYLYPVLGEKGKLEYKPTVARLATRYYCIKKECLVKRHPYFWVGLIELSEEVLQHINQTHIDFLREQLGYIV